MEGGMIVLLIMFICLMLFSGSALAMNHEKEMKMMKGKKEIERDWLCRDYTDIAGIKNCPRCGSKAHMTTTVDIPAIHSEPGKLRFNKFDMRIVYSVRCNNCSIGTANCEEMSKVINDWNSESIFKTQNYSVVK